MPKSKQQRKRFVRIQRQKNVEKAAKRRAGRVKVDKIVADQKEDVVGNNGERVVTPEEMAYMEDTRKAESEPTREQLEKFEADELEAAKKQYESESMVDAETVPFDPKSVLNKYLKKDGV
uniref:Uncharacterized protein n=1 Tax=viral metagenome TaxID=1070528 RepID=A0A6M3KMK7_9ZZZZ